MTMSREKKITKAIWLMEQHPEDFAGKWEDFFSYCPEGDFSFEDETGGDQVPSCGDGENWKSYSFAVDISRKDGIETIKFREYDGDDWDTTSSYDKGPGEKVDQSFAFDALTFNCYYSLLHMAKYNEWCYRNREDPLGNYYLSRVDKPVKLMVEYKEDEEGLHATRSRMSGGKFADGLFGLPENLRYMFENEIPRSDGNYFDLYKKVLEGESCDLSCGGPGKMMLTANGNGKDVIFVGGTMARELTEKKQCIEIRRIANRDLTQDVDTYYMFVVNELKKAGIKI